MAKVKEEEQQTDDGAEPSTTYQMGTIYVQGMSEEEEDSGADSKDDDYSEYEEVDEDDSKAGRTRKLLSSKSASPDQEKGAKGDNDPFLENFDFDPDENWPD